MNGVYYDAKGNLLAIVTDEQDKAKFQRRKRLNWNKNNIDISQRRIEEMMLEDDENCRTLYGIIRAMLWAIGYILERIERWDSEKDREDI